jgi:protein O-mannosyl-transferase
MESQNQQNILPPKDDGNSATPAPANSNNPRLIIGICIFLALIIWAVFGQTRHFSFVNYDDDRYVYNNSDVTNGLTLSGTASAFNVDASDNWVPLTTLSHLLDCQIYGTNAGGHHLSNVLLHAATAILLFLVLLKMTAAIWRSAFVAAVFAIHPLRAESVAWISERKDVLCGVFFMLTLLAYLGYVRKPRSLLRYLLTLFLYALALMSKPVVVTLPFILLLLDYWPLNRRPVSARLIVEKIPFLLLSLASCIPTILAERPGIAPTEIYPVSLRIENSLVSCVAYIWQLFYPVRLAALYPYPYRGLPLVEAAGALAILIIASLAVFHWRRKYPFLLTGWLWYLIMLVPVIGLVQVGEQARADRHTYLSQIGLYMLLTWLVADFCGRFRHRLSLLAGLSSLILAALIYCAHTETAYWKDSVTLWTHTLSCTSANPTALLNLGVAFEKEGRLDDAIAQYQQILKIAPDFTRANHTLGKLLLRQGRLDEAIVQYQKALKLDQGLDASRDCDELGRIYFRKGQTDNAIIQYRKALELDPGNVDACNFLGGALQSEGRLEEAIAPCEAALKIQPDNVRFQSNLAAILWRLTQSPTVKGEKALALAKNASQMAGGKSPLILRALAAAYARCGQFPAAIETGKRALALAAGGQSPAFINTLEQEIALYQAGSPLPIVDQTNRIDHP